MIFLDICGLKKGSGKVKIDDIEEDIEEINNEETLKLEQKGTIVKSLRRTSPFSTSILSSLRKTGWQGRDRRLCTS